MSILDIRKGKVWRKREVIPHLVDSIPQDWKINANKQRFVSGLCLTHTHTHTHTALATFPTNPTWFRYRERTFSTLNDSLCDAVIFEKRHLHGVWIPRSLCNDILQCHCRPSRQAHGEFVLRSRTGSGNFALRMSQFVGCGWSEAQR